MDKKNTAIRVSGRSPRIKFASLGGLAILTVVAVLIFGTVVTQENQARTTEQEAEWLALEADIRARQEEGLSDIPEKYANDARFAAAADSGGTGDDIGTDSRASKLALLESHVQKVRTGKPARTANRYPQKSRHEAAAQELRRKEQSQREWSAFASSGLVQNVAEETSLKPRGNVPDPTYTGSENISKDRYLRSARTPRQNTYEIHAGAMIPAVMKSGLNSDLPGRIVAQVASRVFDSVRPEVCLIPQGARLFGRYDAGVVAGQERVLVIWDELIYPDGSKQSLLGMQGYDTAGYSGLTDKVDSHMRGILGRVMMLSLLTGSLNLAANGMSASGQPAALAYGESAQSEMQSTVSEFLRRGMNRKPTLVIRPGMRVNVMVDRHMVFDRPYGC